MPASLSLIVNPSAGGGRAARIAPDIERSLREHGLDFTRSNTRDLAHARELAVEAARQRRSVVAVSGDGMVGALADSLREVPGAVLGLVPGGRGNDLARVLGIPDDPAGACAIIAQGHTRPVDLGLAAGADGGKGQAFVGIASAGFDSDANRIANEAPAWLGGLVYAYGAIRALISWTPARFEVELDPPGERHVFTGYSVAAANSRAYGGGMMLAPTAMLDDGMLDVIAIERVSKARFLANLPKVFSGRHVDEPSVRVFKAREVSIGASRPFTLFADGDPIGVLPVRVTALAGAITMIVPPTGPDASPFGLPSPAPAEPGDPPAES